MIKYDFVCMYTAHVCACIISLGSPALQQPTQLITVGVIILLITAVTSSVITVLVTAFLTRKCLNKSSQRQSRQHQGGEQEEQDGMYEMVGGGEKKDVDYEIVDLEQKEVVLKDNPAYATYSHL